MLRLELESLAREVARACPAYRVSRREVRVPQGLPLALRWYWEVFGCSALSQRCAAPDDPSAREAAMGVLQEWCQRDVRYDEVAARVEHDHHLIAWDEDELVLLSKGRARMEDDPPLVVLRAPTGASEGPDLEPYSVSTLRFMVAGVLKGLWAELVRVLLLTRPPLGISQPFPRVAPQVARASVGAASVWIAERKVRDRTGFALYFTPEDAEIVESWLCDEGLGDQMLV